MNVRGFRALACAAFATLGACNGTGDNGSAGAQAPGVITGSVLYRERIALRPDAKIEVRLEDVTRADVPADVLAQQTIDTNGRQVPIPFELRYSPSRIDVNHRYGVRASIRAPGGELMFTTTAHRAVLERGAAEQNIELVVQRVSGAPAQSGTGDQAAPGAGNTAGAGDAAGDRAARASLPSGTWRLVAIQRPGAPEESIAADRRYTVAFADGRLTGLAHCNRYQGGYEEPEPGKLKVSPMATTLMACPEPSIADEFLRAVGGATRYELRGERLLLTYGEAGVLIFARD